MHDDRYPERVPGKDEQRAPARRWPVCLFLVCCVWAVALSPAPARACSSHQLEVLPPQPTVADPITLRITGVCSTFTPPEAATWMRNGSLIRLDSAVVIGGIPAPDAPYELLVDIGMLPAGQYRAEYFLEVFAAPLTAGGAAPAPDAVLEFEVLGVTAVPTLDARLLALLAMLLASGGLWALRRA